MDFKMFTEKLLNVKRLPISLALFIIAAASQYLFSMQGFGQIRQEELAEAIRNVYWLEHGYIYDGVSSNIGWYATLLLFYHTAGFSLFAGRLLRVFLHAFSIFCLHRFFVRHMRTPFAELLALMVAFSPTLVYFNSMQTSYAMDMTYFPVLLFSGSIFIEARGKFLRNSILFLFGFIAITGAMSYPSLLFYGPSAILLFFLWKPSRENLSFYNLIPLLIGLILPLLLSFAYLKNPGTLIYDEVARSGLFRGGGRFDFNMLVWKSNMKNLFYDLFSEGNSYYFKAKATEFGSIIAKSSTVLLLLFSFISFIKGKLYRKWFIPPVLIFLILCLIPSFVTGMPGIRRFTGILVVFYWLIAIHFWIIQKEGKDYLQKISLVLGMILCAANIFSCFINGNNLSYRKDYPNQVWFELAETPEKSIALIKKDFKKNNSINLCLKDEKGRPVQPRYAEIYAVLAGDLLWNDGKEIQISACDLKQNRLHLLKPEDWIHYKWPH